MKRFDIKSFAIQADHEWFRAGWDALVDTYREYQADAQKAKTLFGTEEVRISSARFSASLETLGRAVAGSLNMPYEILGNDEESQFYVAIKGHLWETCGSPTNPKGLDEWQDS